MLPEMMDLYALERTTTGDKVRKSGSPRTKHGAAPDANQVATCHSRRPKPQLCGSTS